MFESATIALALINDVLQAMIVIFGVAVFLYNLRHSVRDRVTRAFNSLLFFVVIVYFAELLSTRATMDISSEVWARLGWIGIAMVPAAQFHLADALLVTTGDISGRRRLFVRVWYLTGVAFFILAIFFDLVVSDVMLVPNALHLSSGPLFLLFAIYYWAITVASISMVWRARERCVTHTTRKRMTVILITFLAAPLAVFPYLVFSNDPELRVSLIFWLVLVLGNVLVSIMFAFLTYYIAYFGAASPDRVVRVRLFKFMARVPLAATIVLLVYVLLNKAGSLLGLHIETALAIAIVAAVILIEWAIYAFKKPLERLFQLTDEPEVRLIQQLSERVVTTRDMRQFLESVLAAACEILRTPTAFIVAFTHTGPRLEAHVGPLGSADGIWTDDTMEQLALSAGNPKLTESPAPSDSLESSDGFILWRDFWIRPLYDDTQEALLGIFGVKARAAQPDLTESEEITFARLTYQASKALEDRLLQQEVFAAVEGLLPQLTALQKRRSAATFGGAPVLTAPRSADANVVNDPEFNNMVWDALSHYWGGPKLTRSPLMRLWIVQRAMSDHEGNPTRALREILMEAVERQRPEGDRSMTTAEWILYNILELKFIQGQKVRDVARRLAMSESDLYRKQRVAIENVGQAVMLMEAEAMNDQASEPTPEDSPLEVE